MHNNDMPNFDEAPNLAPALTPSKFPVKTATAESDQSRAVAEVQSMMVIAKRFPRNEIEARDKILTACQRPGLAKTAQYVYARGGANVTGPSIRLAEVMAANWGNITAGWRELSRANGISEIEAFAWDLETNTRWPLVFQVKHVRDTKQGPKPLKEERDIYEICANQAARRVRACVLKLIPGDIIDDAVAQCEETLSRSASVDPGDVKRMVDAFLTDFEVTQEMIALRIQRRLESITSSQVVGLGKIFTSLKDGMSKPEDWFDMKKDAPKPTQPGATAPDTAADPKAEKPSAPKRAAKKPDPEPKQPEPTSGYRQPTPAQGMDEGEMPAFTGFKD